MDLAAGAGGGYFTLNGRDARRRRDGGPCRRVAPDLLRALLIQPDLADHSPHGVLIRGAHIDGSLDLADAHIKAAVVMLDASWITGDVVLDDARLDGILRLRGTRIEGKVYLRGAHIDGQMEMDGTIIANQGASCANQPAFDAKRLHVRADGLYMRDVKFDGPVDLLAHISMARWTWMVPSSPTKRGSMRNDCMSARRAATMRNVKFGGKITSAAHRRWGLGSAEESRATTGSKRSGRQGRPSGRRLHRVRGL